jgi:hypothetical protein
LAYSNPENLFYQECHSQSKVVVGTREAFRGRHGRYWWLRRRLYLGERDSRSSGAASKSLHRSS